MEIVHDDDCKAIVMVIISEMCPSAMKMEDIFISCDPDKTSRDVELFFDCSTIKFNSMMSCDVIIACVNCMDYLVT